MATTELTITVLDDQMQSIHKLIAAGKTHSVSAFVRHAIDLALLDAVGWRAMLHETLQETGGPLTEVERTWADSILRPAD
jgi:hypothetical protein